MNEKANSPIKNELDSRFRGNDSFLQIAKQSLKGEVFWGGKKAEGTNADCEIYLS